MQLKELELKANAIRKRALRMIFEAKTGHLGGTMSMTDILVALYYYKMNVDPKQPNKYDRDRFVLSKGHSVETLYCVLADMGFFLRMSLIVILALVLACLDIQQLRCLALKRALGRLVTARLWRSEWR